MSISTTYLVLQEQIADELGDRTDLLSPLSDSGLVLSPIQNAIQSAISLLEDERFYFNELFMDANSSSTWQTSNGQEYYGASTSPKAWSTPDVSKLAKIDKLWVLINANRYKLNPRVSQYLIDTSVNPAVLGFPVDWSYASEQVRLYQIPDNTYYIGVLGTTRAAALSSGSDANWWTQDAFDLTRSMAKLILAREVIHDAGLAQEMEYAIDGRPGSSLIGYRTRLRNETSKRRGAGRIRPTYF